MPSISICIPTYRRPTLLAHALESALLQTRRPLEILVGDDSPDAEGAAVVGRVAASNPTAVRHLGVHSHPGQAGNVERLFAAAAGDYVVLLHDDDILLPEACAVLGAALDADVAVGAVYGKQYVMGPEGVFDRSGSEQLNADYLRDAEHAGTQPCALTAALLQQFPNDGYMLRTRRAVEAGYRSGAERAGVRDGCDMLFGVNLARNGTRFQFIDRYLSAYRIGNESIARGGDTSAALDAMRIFTQLAGRVPDHPALRAWLRRTVPGAIDAAAQRRQRRLALAWYLSSAHRPYLMTAGAAKRLLAILSPGLARRIDRGRSPMRRT